MARLGRLRFVAQDTSGNASAGASIEIRRQGSTVNGTQAGPITSITVNSPNGVVVGDSVAVGTSGTTRTVSSITATNVTVGGPGFSGVSDDDRLSITSGLPTLYQDADGVETVSNPLTTDSNGRAQCYVLGGLYDVLVSGGSPSLTTVLYEDVGTEGAESTRSNEYQSGTTSNHVMDTLRAAAAGDKLLDVQTAGVSKLSVAGDGEIVAGAAGATHNLTGTLTVSAGETITAGGLTVTSGHLVMTLGSVQVNGAAQAVTQASGLGANTFAGTVGISNNLTVSGSGKGITVTGTGGITNSGGDNNQTGGRTLSRSWIANTDLDTTPDVSGGNNHRITNSGATSITYFDGGPNASGVQELTLLFVDANSTIVHNAANIRLAGGANFVSSAADILRLISDNSNPTIWIETGRSVNG